ncbi:MAG: hypothetical protein ABS87_06555 [Sphingomonas sp. SCN 67-18]|nr:Tad domain-containing protein [Sphingomonas sp. SCN 67-18]ODU21485.1 MAG: hypothetical protein ABS87_06555 [Sphingomonas sp. SCN 67-18]
MTDKSTKPETRKRSLAALLADTTGNTIAIMAASLLPLTAMAGSAIDMSRLYVAKVRLQQACDAGALAGRRFMVDNTLDENSREQATKFFNFNFPEGWFRTTSVSFEPTLNAQGQVEAVARATVPMVIMQAFGKDPVPLSVNCEAKFELSNTDVMFVLDTTGSMNCAAADTEASCSNNGNVEKSNARIKALRTAVISFYDTIEGTVDSTARLRFGFMPYSTSVNVGKLLPSAYLVDDWTYQSRVANYTTYDYTDSSGTTSWQTYPSGTLSQSNCLRYMNNTGSYATDTKSGGPPPTTETYYTFPSDGEATAGGANGEWGWSGAPTTSGSNRSCRRKRTETVRTYSGRFRFTDWTYKPVQYDVRNYKAGSNVTLANSNNGTVATSGSYNAQQLATAGSGVSTISSSWSGCIEERDTNPQATFATVPSDAYDLDLDSKPDTTTKTRWRPQWDDLLFDRSGTAEQTTSTTRTAQSASCPKEARRLAAMTKSEVQTYVDASTFKATGNTYHDVGMIWGARFLSPTGIFSADNASAPNGKPISRHIIFMTDGAMKPGTTTYSLYAYEKLDRRVSGSANTPTDSDLKSRHNERFVAMCKAARAMNITIWVVAYAQTMTDELEKCADPGKAFYASNDADLKARFQAIASQIAELRLSK